ncbi:MAG: response regulator transcription factor [Bacteroidetes bacterium]|nr:response regulator transcription factor [Bacteroidota bacterium]
MINKLNILVIDDDQDIGRMLKMLLEFKGFSVTIAENKTMAVETLNNTPMDIIIMDMLLSGENGINICVDFKNTNDIKQIPILMMSAHPDAKIICLDAGANDFIPKPFEMQDMLMKIYQLIMNKKKGNADDAD